MLFFVALVSANFGASAQQSAAKAQAVFRDFIDADSLSNSKNNHQFFIGSFSVEQISDLHNNKAIQIQRQLNDSVFIVTANKLLFSTLGQTSFGWLKKASANWKLSSTLLLQQKNKQLFFPAAFLISILPGTYLAERKKEKILELKTTSSTNIFIATVNTTDAFNELLQDESVVFIGAYNRHPTEELQINDLDLSVNKINLLHSRMPFLNGEGTTISIKENLPDTTDIDIAARYLYNPLAATVVSSHASIMSTMAAGAGNSYYLGKGVASAATITSSNFSNLLPDADISYQQTHISVQNHSYGVGIENFYGADAAAYDASALKNDTVLFVFSAGNFGNLAATAGNYAGLAGHANISGSFKMAKNIITVGAVDSFETVANASSRGPAYDGRIKPEIVAYGEDGTSGAAALVSGTAAVLQQAYAAAHGGNLPSSALLKAILLNSADDVGPSGPDYTSGYGNLNAIKALEDLTGNNFISGKVANNESKEFSITIPSDIRKAKFMLVWNDMPAVPNAYKALVNDLDMELQLPAANQLWQPWVLNSFANADSLSALPVRKRDSLNTIEQITLDNPIAGDYKIVVKGFNISSRDQSFYIAYQLDTTNLFSWNFPSATDNLFPASANIVRWNTDRPAANAHLMYSIDKGNNWYLMDSLINTSNKYYYWNVPDTNALAILKMHTSAGDFLSDTFTISKKLGFKTGFNCADSVLYFWNKLQGVSSYQIYSLQGKYLQPVATTTDTQFVFNKKNLPYRQFAVAPILNGKNGVKSYTTDYTMQGLDCYINNFLTDLQNDNTAKILLQTGTDYLIKRVVFEKLQSGSFFGFKEVTSITGLHFTATDTNLQKGVNTYRARIELKDGRIIYSFTSNIFYFNNAAVVVFPNPVIQNNILTIQMSELQNQRIKIIDITGRTVYNKKATSTALKIPFFFSKGIYFITVFNPETSLTNVLKISVN